MTAPESSPDRQPAAPPERASIPFREEVNAAIRYERGLAVKAALALLLVALVLVVHVLWLS
jgi:hypothetical protein